MPLLISRSGVAAAAHVQRPVVTMWQQRPVSYGVSTPFPEPYPGTGDLFDLDEVIAWQERSGRGNNPSFALDAPQYARPTDGTDGAHDDAVGALIALAAVADADLTTTEPADLTAAAAVVDPDDESLQSEVRAAAARADLRELATRRIEAAYGAGPAIEAIATARSRVGADRAWVVTEAVVSLLRDMCLSLVPEGPTVADGGARPGDLALRIALADTERSIAWRASAEAQAAPEARDQLRRLRRRALVADLPQISGPTPVHVLQLPHRDTPRASAVQMLRAIDDLTLALPAGAVGIALGPASALCDALGDRQAVLARADVLRTGRLRAVVRMPHGIVLDRPRAELGLWVLGDADPDAAIADRLLVVGDLSTQTLGPEVVDGLVTDLVAALAGVGQIRARAFAHCRPIRTSQVLATDAALVAHRPPAPPTEPTRAAAAAALTTTERMRARGVDLGVELRTALDPEPGRRTTLGALIAAGEARVIAGRRISSADLGAGSVWVIGAAEVRGDTAPATRIDALVAHGRYARALTEPGDAVVIARPRPQAMVDAEGGSIVAYPARIVRLRIGSAHALAAAVNSLPPGATALESWTVPVPAASAVAGLEAVLRSVVDRRHALRAELAELDELETTMVDGVTSGALVVSPHEEKE